MSGWPAYVGLLLLGGALLYLGAEWLVGGSARLAQRLKVSPLVVGLTVVAYGTSAPEVVVSLQAGFSGHGELGSVSRKSIQPGMAGMNGDESWPRLAFRPRFWEGRSRNALSRQRSVLSSPSILFYPSFYPR